MAANDRIGSEHNDERLFHSISIALHKEQKNKQSGWRRGKRSCLTPRQNLQQPPLLRPPNPIHLHENGRRSRNTKRIKHKKSEPG